MTVAAVYQVANPATGEYADYVLGCISFTFYDEKGDASVTVPGVPKKGAVTIKETSKSPYEKVSVPAANPDNLWDEAYKAKTPTYK